MKYIVTYLDFDLKEKEITIIAISENEVVKSFYENYNGFLVRTELIDERGVIHA